MGKLRALFWLFTVSTAWIASYFLKAVPPEIEDPWKIRIFNGIYGIITDMAKLGEKLGIDSRVNLTRSITRIFRPPTSTSNDKMLISDNVFDGIPVRVYRPHVDASVPLPVLVYYHGGGWIFGNVGYNPLADVLVPNTSIVIVSVEYRLAPEHPYPAPLDDCHKATVYVVEHASELGIDVSKVMVGGDSAGGNLAAAVSHRMKNSNPPLLAQLLIYPVLQSLNFQLPSYQLQSTPVLSTAMMLACYQYYFTGVYNASFSQAMLKGVHVTDRVREQYSQYVDYRKLPESFRKDHVEPDIVTADTEVAQKLEQFILNTDINPLLNPDLAGLPSALVMTCEYDILRNDGALYAVRLQEAGVDVQHLDYKKGFHGMAVLIVDPFRFESGMRLVNDLVEFVRNKIA